MHKLGQPRCKAWHASHINEPHRQLMVQTTEETFWPREKNLLSPSIFYQEWKEAQHPGSTEGNTTHVDHTFHISQTIHGEMDTK